MSATRSGPREPAQSAAHKLPAHEYAKIHGYSGGDTVKVLVGKEKKVYTIPKDLLCNYSEFFRAAFENNFLEGIQQICTLESAEVETFEMVLQWIGTGCVILPEIRSSADELVEETEKVSLKESESNTEEAAEKTQDSVSSRRGSADWGTIYWSPIPSMNPLDPKTVEDKRNQFQRYLEFLFLADCLLISPSPIEFMEDMIRKLCSCGWAPPNPKPIDFLDSSIITKAWQLSSTNPIRKLLAKACTDSYIDCHVRNPKNPHLHFKFADELVSVSGFAEQLMEITTKTIMRPQIDSHPINNSDNEYSHNFTIVAPIVETSYTWQNRSRYCSNCWGDCSCENP